MRCLHMTGVWIGLDRGGGWDQKQLKQIVYVTSNIITTAEAGYIDPVTHESFLCSTLKSRF